MIMIGVPGPWKDHGELYEAMRQAHGPPYFVTPNALWDMQSGTMCGIEIVDHVERLANTFRIAGQGELSQATLDAIAHHGTAVCVISDEVGYDAVRRVAKFGALLLQAGGYAVKVDSVGVAHEKERWLADCESENPFDIYALFVTLITADECYFSCGMHNFGLPDAAVESSVKMEESAHLLNVFNFYQLTESPEFIDGETFSVDPKARRFRLEKRPYMDYEPGSPLRNPHGMWYMTLPESRLRRWLRRR